MSHNSALSNANKLWLYYKKCLGPSGEFLGKAECMSCSKYLVYKGSDNNGSLWRHLKHFHGVQRQYSDVVLAQSKTTAANTTAATTTAATTTTTTTTAITTKLVSPQPESNLQAPVKKKEVMKTVMPATSMEIYVKPAETIDTRNVPLYRYFTLYKGSGKVKCRVCMSAALPTALLTNQATHMLSHLEKHPRAYKLYELEVEYGTSGPEFDERVHLPEKTPSIFTQIAEGIYQCIFCQSTMSGSMEMQKHLRDKHRGISEQEIGKDVIYTEVVFVGDKEKKKAAKRKPKFSKNPLKGSDNTKKNFENTDVDAFGHYVTSLLKSMPKEESTKLQQTIVNNIIEAKLKASCERSKNQDTSITEVQSEDAIIALVTNDEEEHVVANNQNDDDLTDAGEDIEQVVVTEEHIEDMEEEHLENTEGIQKQKTYFKRFKYANDSILELQ